MMVTYEPRPDILKKNAPAGPAGLAGIEESPSVEITSGAPIVGALERCWPPFDRPLRNAIPIRNVFRNGISRDWRSLSRCCGLRAFFYVPESCSPAYPAGSPNVLPNSRVLRLDWSLEENEASGGPKQVHSVFWPLRASVVQRFAFGCGSVALRGLTVAARVFLAHKPLPVITFGDSTLGLPGGCCGRTRSVRDEVSTVRAR
jgi:hypothetical protein